MQLTDSLRSAGDRGRITIISEEPGLPYQRPQLSKEYIASSQTPQPLPLRAMSFFTDHDVALLKGTRATRVDRAHRRVKLSDGGSLPYSELVFATGTRARTLNIEGSDLAGIHYRWGILAGHLIEGGLQAAVSALT